MTKYGLYFVGETHCLDWQDTFLKWSTISHNVSERRRKESYKAS